MILNSNQDLSLVTLKALKPFYALSVPTLNTCTKNGLTDLNKIISFYLNHKSFVKLHLVGKHTNEELVAFCQHFLDNPARYDAFIAQKTFLFTQLASLSAFQKEMVGYQIQLEIKTLRTSICNVILDYLNNNISFDNFVNTFIYNEIDFSYDRNIGTQAIKILADMIQKIENIALGYAAIPNKVLNAPTFMAILTSIFPIEPKDKAIFLPAMENKAFPLFSFLNYLLENEKFIESKKLYIIKHYLDCFKTEKLTITTISENIGISREQVRQFSISSSKIINQVFIFLSAYKHSIQHFTNYEYDLNEFCMQITPDFVDNMNQNEKTNFSKKFISQCCGLLWDKTHILFGHHCQHFKNAYLIQIPIFDPFLFECFFDEIKDYLEKPQYEDVRYNFTDFLAHFTQEEVPDDLLVKVQSVCKTIITNEFAQEVEFDFEKNIIFKQNRQNIQNDVHEKIVMILREKNVPMKIHEIHAVFNEKYPDSAKTFDYIKKTLYRNKIFIHFGRSSTYALAEWEETQNDLKGGTIRDIVETYLNPFNEPKHISEIADYVLKYRPKSDLYKINTNLIAESSQRFTEFKGNFWGLSHKKYEDTDFNETPAFFLRYVKRMLLTATDTRYETILAALGTEFKLKPIQVQYLLEKYIKEDVLRRENNLLEIC